MIKKLLSMRKNDTDILNFNINIDSDKWTIIKNISFIVMLFIVGKLQYDFSTALQDSGSNISMMLLVFYMATTIVELIFAIIRSSNILFSSKDNSLLLSLPIKKRQIVISRVVLLLISQYIINIILMLPAIIVYSILEMPFIHFYVPAVISVLLLPIIPTIIGSIIGYVVEIISNKFRNKNLAQILITVGILIAIFVMLFNADKITIQARTLEEFLFKLYYPLGAFIASCSSITGKEILITLIINIIALVAFIEIINLFFIKILKVNLESRKKKANKNIKYRKRKKQASFFKKEIKRYFSKPIYILNTLLLPVMFLAGAIYLNILGTDKICEFLKTDFEGVQRIFLSCIVTIIPVVASTGNTTSVSITLEGKFNWINKSLPIDTMDIFKGKILVSRVVIMPITMISTLIFLITFKVPIILSILIMMACFIITDFIFVLGLIINLIVPDMDYLNEGLAIKQSKSALSTTIISTILSALITWIYNSIGYQKMYLFLSIIIVAFGVLTMLAWKVIKNQGKYRYENL